MAITRMRFIRLYKGLKAWEVARKLHITETYLHKIERGEVQSVSPKLRKKIEDFYGDVFENLIKPLNEDAIVR
jgi:transcriptional regulator with XRE-family HTH domain